MLEVSILLNELNWSVQNFGINSLLKQQSISFFEVAFLSHIQLLL